jgi:hypothetical protein
MRLGFSDRFRPPRVVGRALRQRACHKRRMFLTTFARADLDRMRGFPGHGAAKNVFPRAANLAG